VTVGVYPELAHVAAAEAKESPRGAGFGFQGFLPLGQPDDEGGDEQAARSDAGHPVVGGEAPRGLAVERQRHQPGGDVVWVFGLVSHGQTHAGVMSVSGRLCRKAMTSAGTSSRSHADP